MKVTVLGSGSTGNATLVEADGVRILIDAGFSGRDLERRLHLAGAEPDSLAGVIITHDHSDHTRGMGVIARRFGIPLYLTPKTAARSEKLLSGTEEIRPYTSAAPFRVGPFEIDPFLTVHDAVDPVAVTVRHVESALKFGIATDLGRPTAAVRHALSGCHLLMLEANHDEALLWNCHEYPWAVKQRIASSHGHLSNHAAAELIRELHHPLLGAVVLAHLSERCNEGELAREVVGLALEQEGFHGSLLVAGQAEPLETIALDTLERERPGAEQLLLL